MWVRSQDKKRLIHIDNIIVNFNTIVIFNIEGLVTLGSYDSEDRAIEILNEIQDTIQTEALYKHNQEAANCYGGDFDFIYKMPQE